MYRSVFEAATTAKPGALVEGSWLNPPLSRSYAQTWRYGDEVAEFNFSYPYNGLAQKLDYVILQRQMLGVRPDIGYLRGPGTATRIQQQWMRAGLALGAQFAVAVDFTEMTPEAAESTGRSSPTTSLSPASPSSGPAASVPTGSRRTAKA